MHEAGAVEQDVDGPDLRRQCLDRRGRQHVETVRLRAGETLLRSWKVALQDQGDQAFPGNGRLPAVVEEPRRLRADNKRLLMEREILKKATAFFAREQP